MTIFMALAAVLVVTVLALALRPLWHGSRGLAARYRDHGNRRRHSRCTTWSARPPRSIRKQLAAPNTLADAVTQLEAELARDPKQVEGWRLLGQAYTTEQRFDDARSAYAKAAELVAAGSGRAGRSRAGARVGRTRTPLRRRSRRAAATRTAGATDSISAPAGSSASRNARPAAMQKRRKPGNRCSRRSTRRPPRACVRRSMPRARTQGCHPCLPHPPLAHRLPARPPAMR